MSRGHAGTSSLAEQRSREPAGAAGRRARAGVPPAPAAGRAGGRLDRRPAARQPQRHPLGARRRAARARSPLTSLPVSIPTGQASAQVPSAAHVSMRVVLVLARAAPRAPASRPAGAPSRGAARSAGAGVVVRSRLGQTGSQKPHSTQAVASGSIGGVVFRLREVDAGVVVQHHARGEHAVGVGERLDPPHQLGRLRAPLALDVRRHVDAGPVLGLQRAVVPVDDQRRRARP